MSKIDKELREQRIRLWLSDITRSKFTIVFLLAIVAILSWNIYRSSDEVIESEELQGVLVGIHQVQGNLGSGTTMLAIKLNNGNDVMVTAPEGLVIHKNSNVLIYKDKTEKGFVYYNFKSYRDLK